MGLLGRLFSDKLTEDRFAENYIRILKSLGDTRQTHYDKSEFQLQFSEQGKDAGAMNLRNLFEEYRRLEKCEREEWLKRTCSALFMKFELPDEFADAAPDIRPSLRSPLVAELVRLSATARGKEFQAMATVPVSKYLCATLVYDLPNRMEFIGEERLQGWSVTTYEAFETAKRNLEEMTGALAVIDDRVFIAAEGDAYDATKMLRLGLVRSLPLNGAPVAMPVTRDCLIITGADDDVGLGVMADIAESKKEDPRPICTISHRLTGDEWEPWIPAPDHPHFEKFMHLKIRHLASEYAEQKATLDKLNEEQGVDIFVASCSAAAPDEGPPFSYCVWSKGVTTWLPETYRVGFYDDAVKGITMAAWEQVREVVGHLMEAVETFPPRWLVNEFPSAEQLATMKGERV